MVHNIEKNKAADAARARAARRARKRKIQRLTQEAKKKPKGVALMNGQLLHNLENSRGRLLNCETQLAKCGKKPKKTVSELGEGRHYDTKRIKHTAIQDDRIARHVPDPLAKEKLKDKYRLQKHTAKQQYVRDQNKPPYSWLPGAAGWKLAHDRMSTSSLHRMVKDADTQIKISQKY